MKNDRWDVIERLFHAARELSAENRTKYLDEACGPDVALRRKVELLLEQDEKTEAFLNAPALQLVVAPMPPGTAVGPYEVIDVVGRGGMGLVYRARDTRLKREVAIKTLPAELAHDPEFLARFQREATVLASLNHPNIATIYDVLELDRAPYLVLEFVEGATLRERLENGPFNSKEVLPIAEQIALALQAAHQKGIVHRDLKPGNIMVNSEGRVKVLDFGLAKTRYSPALDADDVTKSGTKPGVLMGTVHYMSPEQALGREVDPRSDIFSIGVVLYQLLTGRRPFSGETEMETINAIINAEPQPIASLNAEVLPGLDRVITRCLAKKTGDRFQNAGDLLNDLRECGVQPQSRRDGTRTNLGQPLTRFIGRRGEIAEIRRLLKESRLVTLSGSGGIGKTRLAMQLAIESLNDYPDGVWFVDLAPLSNSELVPQTVAFTLGVREERGRVIAESLADYLRRRNLLLVLDNCEHLIGACAHLTDAMLRNSQTLHILATSREALTIAGETVFRVPALSVPDPERISDIGSLRELGAVELFVDRARAVKAGFDVSSQNSRTLARVCSRLEGIPLALELAASRLKVLSIEQIDARLDDRLSLLKGGSRTALPRHQTLLAAIDWSYNLLTETEQTLFRRLAVFSGGWTLEAAENVCAGNGVEQADVLELLSELVDKSLVLAEERDGQQRYRLMATFSEYGARRLAQSEDDEIRLRHATFFVGLADWRKEPGVDQKTWLERVNVEHDNMRAVLNWSLRKNVDLGLRLATALELFWLRSGLWAEARQWLSALLAENASLATPFQRASALNVGAFISWRVGDYSSCISLSEQALRIFRELDDKPGISTALNNLGRVALSRNDYGAAWSIHQESLEVVRGLADKRWPGIVLSCLGIVAYRRGDYKQARALHEENLAIFRELGDKSWIAAALTNLGNLSYDEADYKAAWSIYQESLSIHRDLGDKRGWADGLGNLGLVAHELGDYAQARSLQEECLSIRREMGEKFGMANALGNLGGIAFRQGDYESARTLYGESLALRRELGNKGGIAQMLIGLGDVSCRLGDHEAAHALFTQSLAIHREISESSGIAGALNGLAAVARSRADYASAIALYKESLEIFWKLGARADVLLPLEKLAALHGGRGRRQRAASLWSAAETMRQKLSAPRPPIERDEYDHGVAAARSGLGEELFAAAWSRGGEMSTEEVIAYALGEDES